MTAPTVPPTLLLPVVHVHGATSWRRRVFLLLLTIGPTIPAFVLSIVAPPDDAGDSVVLPGMAMTSLVWLLLAARAFPPLARWGRPVSATLVGASWALGVGVATMDRETFAWSAPAVAAVAVATLVGTWSAWWLGGLRFGVVAPLVRPAPAPTSPSSRSAWSETVTHTTYAVFLLVATALIVLYLVATGFAAGTWLTLVPLAAFTLLSALPFAIRITADRRGLRIRSRVLGIPLATVPLDRIASATAALIDETEWGQVGSTADRELTTIIHRSGAALIVTRTDGSMVVVTADRPDLAAAVLESLRVGAAHD